MGRGRVVANPNLAQALTVRPVQTHVPLGRTHGSTLRRPPDDPPRVARDLHRVLVWKGRSRSLVAGAVDDGLGLRASSSCWLPAAWLPQTPVGPVPVWPSAGSPPRKLQAFCRQAS